MAIACLLSEIVFQLLLLYPLSIPPFSPLPLPPSSPSPFFSCPVEPKAIANGDGDDSAVKVGSLQLVFIVYIRTFDWLGILLACMTLLASSSPSSPYLTIKTIDTVIDLYGFCFSISSSLVPSLFVLCLMLSVSLFLSLPLLLSLSLSPSLPPSLPSSPFLSLSSHPSFFRMKKTQLLMVTQLNQV